MKKLSEFGINPNHNYVDPVEGVPHKVKTKDGKTVNLPAAGVWPRTLYREEWDDMIKDPISDAVVQQRESLLPEILQGDVNDEDNVSDAYEMAYLETKPEDLNWSKYIRKAGKLYNNFVNRLSDNFILSWIILPVILFRYISTIGRYFPSNSL